MSITELVASRPDRSVFAQCVNSFPDTDPRIPIWQRYPHVSIAEDDATDTFACDVVSTLFVRHARARGLRAMLVRADEAESPWVGLHCWARVWVNGVALDVDWTVRQFHNLEHPPNPRHARVPVPLVWDASDRHPIAGRFRSVAFAPA